MPHCVMVAQQILVLYVWVRVLVGQQKINFTISATKKISPRRNKFVRGDVQAINFYSLTTCKNYLFQYQRLVTFFFHNLVKIGKY